MEMGKQRLVQVRVDRALGIEEGRRARYCLCSLFTHGLGGRRGRRRWPSERSQCRLCLSETVLCLLPVWAELQSLVVMRDGKVILSLIQVGVGQVQVGVSHARIETGRFVISLDGK